MRASQKKILLVDDATRRLHKNFQAFISKKSLEVHVALSGPDAIAQAIQEQPHYIVLDIGILQYDSIEIVDALKRAPQTRDIPIIISCNKGFNQAKFKKIIESYGPADPDVRLLEENAQIVRQMDLLNQKLQFEALRNIEVESCFNLMIKALNDVCKSLPYSQDSCRQRLMELIQKMRLQLDNSIWNEFERRFSMIHSGFYDHLLHDFPALTENDLKIAAFIKLKLKTKEIAFLTNQPENTIRMARKRLRQKLNIHDPRLTLLQFMRPY